MCRRIGMVVNMLSQDSSLITKYKSRTTIKREDFFFHSDMAVTYERKLYPQLPHMCQHPNTK